MPSGWGSRGQADASYGGLTLVWAHLPPLPTRLPLPAVFPEFFLGKSLVNLLFLSSQCASGRRPQAEGLITTLQPERKLKFRRDSNSTQGPSRTLGAGVRLHAVRSVSSLPLYTPFVSISKPGRPIPPHSHRLQASASQTIFPGCPPTHMT